MRDRQRLLASMPWCHACRQLDVRFSITIRQHASLRELIEAIPEQDWTPIDLLDLDGAADVAETTYGPPGQSEGARHAQLHRPARLIVRRVKPTPGSGTCALLIVPTTARVRASSPTGTCRKLPA